MNLTRYYNKKRLRCGYTTGSCAAAAAKAAVTALLTGERIESVTINTPAGIPLELEITELTSDKTQARCAVKKDGGDDPDITSGVLVFAQVSLIEGCAVTIDGGEGVGRITKPGLDRAVGEAAINSAPRAMIEREVLEICEKNGYRGGVSVVISIPGGEKLARRTFNPKMGIEGGLSVLGTSGIVEPMSDKAVIDTIKLEISILAAAGENEILLTIGNYGTDFVKNVLAPQKRKIIKCSNFLGDAIDAAVSSGFGDVLVVGHIGKLVKLGIGVTDTHSKHGDGRIETLIACALRAGAPIEALRELSECVTTDAAIDVLKKFAKFSETMSELGMRIDETLKKRVPDTVKIGFICFSGEEILCMTNNGENTDWLKGAGQWYIL